MQVMPFVIRAMAFHIKTARMDMPIIRMKRIRGHSLARAHRVSESDSHQGIASVYFRIHKDFGALCIDVAVEQPLGVDPVPTHGRRVGPHGPESIRHRGRKAVVRLRRAPAAAKKVNLLL